MNINKIVRTKPYKAMPPQKTVALCKKILSDYGITTSEDVFPTAINGKESFWNCRIKLENAPNYSTGGKGCTKDYALASGYGEFLERLQNNLLIPMPQNRSFKFANDEKFFQLKDVIESNYNILSSIFGIVDKSNLTKYLSENIGNEIVALPYYNFFEDKIHYLPIGIIENFINLFNGNCAGNTNIEAIIHGLCEIMERYAAREIYKNEYNLPDIPLDYFKGFDIYERIISFEKELNIKIIIKDCSLGEKLPVIGAILINKDLNKYSFQLGSDPSPVTALERCFTEIFQDGREFANFTHLGIDPFDPPEFYDRPTYKALHFVYTNEFAKGKWPNSIFYPGNTEFSGFDHTASESDEKDLEYLLGILKQNKRQLFIRDVSFLGFPTFNIYIPGMSDYVLTNPQKYVNNLNDFIRNIPVLKNINGSNINKLNDLAYILDKLVSNPEPFISFNISSFYKNINEELGVDLNNDLFLFLLFYKIENFEKASFYINKYINSTGLSIGDMNPYYLCVRDYVSLKSQNNTNITELLLLVYSPEVIEEVLIDMGTPQTVFKYFKLPSCPNCGECIAKPDCNLINIRDISKTVYNTMRDSYIDQKNISNIFEYTLKRPHEHIIK